MIFSLWKFIFKKVLFFETINKRWSRCPNTPYEKKLLSFCKQNLIHAKFENFVSRKKSFCCWFSTQQSVRCCQCDPFRMTVRFFWQNLSWCRKLEFFSMLVVRYGKYWDSRSYYYFDNIRDKSISQIISISIKPI